MARRAVQISQLVPGAEKPFALVPIGMYCNRELQRAEPGDALLFCTDWRRDRRILVRKCRVAVNSGVFTFLLKSLYGERATFAELAARWRAWAVVQGLGADGFSLEEVLLIEVKEEKHEK